MRAKSHQIIPDDTRTEITCLNVKLLFTEYFHSRCLRRPFDDRRIRAILLPKIVES